MEEIAIIFSSVAGACTAVALDKVPKIKRKKSPTINSAISSQIHTLKMEKEILTKTIARLNQQESAVSKIQKDKLLLSYEHQLGTVISKIEKLELASRYPDFGPVGDSLVSLMDKRLSQLDERLHEISAKITTATIQDTKQKLVQTEKIEQKPEIQKEKTVIQKQQIEIEIENQVPVENEIEIQRPKEQELLPPIQVPAYEKHRMVELSTLTEITNRVPQFPEDLIIKPAEKIQPEITQKVIEPEVTVQPATETSGTQESFVQPQQLSLPQIIEKLPELPKPDTIIDPQKKIELPPTIKIPEEEKLEDDDKDLDKIKSEIMKALSKLEQVEVE